GELSIPADLLTHLRMMGVKVLKHYPDRDETGLRTAAKLYHLLKDSDILYMPFALPGADDSKHDINWLWIESGFDKRVFETMLLDTKALSESDLAAWYTPAPSKVTPFPLNDTELGTDSLPDGFVRAIL